MPKVRKTIAAAVAGFAAVRLWRLVRPASISRRADDDLASIVIERDDLQRQLQAEIDNRERLEAALVQAKKIEAIGKLTSGIAHDFNNLLQAVAGNLELIGMNPGQRGKVERWAANATSAVERGTRLTRQLLTFSRQQRLEMRSIDVATMLAGMRELVRNSVGPTVELEISAEEGLGTVNADPTQLELAVLNLAINARDAMPSGGRLTVKAQARMMGDEQAVAIVVSDTGTGMSDDVMERALERFFTTKPLGEGTGLGLSMAYGMTQQAGGELTLSSREGEGTTVTMLIPCGEPIVQAPEEALVAEVTSLVPARSASILLVDDDPEVCTTLADLLTVAGHRVRQAHGGADALSMLEDGETDLMLLDFAMPEMNGAELASAASAAHPELKMLFITGISKPEMIDQAVDWRVGVLKKPVSAGVLASAIGELLG